MANPFMSRQQEEQEHHVTTHKTDIVTCWSCRAEFSGGGDTTGRTEDRVLFCPVCGALQPFQTSDPFALLGVRPSYRLDVADVERRYLQLQAQMHPDRFYDKQEQEKRIAAVNAASLNQSYQALRDPLRRAAALLALAGHEATAFGEQKTIADSTLLTEMMTLREELEDGADESVRQRYQTLMIDCEDAIDAAYRIRDWQVMDKQATRLRYLLRLGADLGRTVE